MIKEVKRFDYSDSTKYVFFFPDDSIIETAVFDHKGQTHFCISTQVGCPVGCMHCATTYSRVKFKRNLRAEEMVYIIDTILSMEKTLAYKVLSFSGHGEPLLNWQEVCKAGCSYIRVFDSFYLTTIGIRDVLKQIITDNNNLFTYYVSLHGVPDRKRNFLIPNSERYATVEELLKFTRKYSSRGGKVVLNYMLHNGNADKSDIDRLLGSLEGLNQNVRLRLTGYNSIEYNTTINGLTLDDTKNVLSYIESQRLTNSEWSYNYSFLEGEKDKTACGQLRADIIVGEDG